MILQNPEKSNTSFIETLKEYESQLNFGYLICPKNCGATDFIRWSSYERYVIYFNNGHIETRLLTIKRVRCKACGATHAILPHGVIPYKQFVDEVISKVLHSSCETSLERLSNLYSISQSTLKKWAHQFKTVHLSRVATLVGKHHIKEILDIFAFNNTLKQDYIIQNNRCFMQIKLGCFYLCPS